MLHCCCYPVLLLMMSLMMSDHFLAFPLLIPVDKEVLLLSFCRGVTESHRASKICFRFHQKFVGKQDFKSSPVLFLPVSPTCSEQEGSKVPVRFLLTAQPLLHPALFIQFHTIPPSPAHQFTFISITLLF